jgi:hypothetical protein
MEIKLNEAEVLRALQYYVARQTNTDKDALIAKIQWHARTATVQVPPIPVLKETDDE